ncbi:MAG: mechanosensitive ion channel family protein [Bacteroidales bacterium]|nr:mechanosensitive ion channel family protein [Bacteroidales bacterium]
MTDFLIEMFRDLSEYLMATFTGWGMSFDMASLLKNIINLIFIACISAISWYVAKVIIIRLIHMIVYKTENKYDDQLVNHKVVEPLSQIFPAAYIYYLIQFAISDPEWVERIRNWCFSWNVFSLIIILFRAIDAVHDVVSDILAQKQRKTNIRGYVQVAKIIVGLFGGFGIISILIGQNPLSLFGGLAGISAILMLVFKDSISGFVASIQLTSLDMVKMNDWITMAGRNIEGNVVEITLNTIKVRNFDNSVVTVPTANLMSESFINWSNMQEMEARRLKRTIMIDADSIGVASPELIERAKKNPLLADYISERLQDSADQTENLLHFDKREITNLELFRKYIEFYIKANYQIFKKYKPTTITDEKGNTRELYIIEDKADFLQFHGAGAEKFLMEYKGKTIIKDFEKFIKECKQSLVADKKDKKTYYPIRMIKNTTYINDRAKTFMVPKRIVLKDGIFVENGHLMVRQMQSTPTGVPLEIYCFTKITEWASFEKLMSGFFEHLFAIIKDFDLRTYQLSRNEVRQANVVS